MSMWSAVALWAAVVWDRMPQKLRAGGAIAVGLFGIISVTAALFLVGAARHLNGNWGTMDARWTAWRALQEMPISAWLVILPSLPTSRVFLVLFSLVAPYFLFNNIANTPASPLSPA